MASFFKTIWNKRLLTSFAFSALLIFIVGAVGVVGVLRVSRSFEKLETDVVGSITELEEIRSSFSVMLLDMTTFLILEFPTAEAEDEQVSRVEAYKEQFENAVDKYNKRIIGDFKKNDVVPESDIREISLLVETIIEKRQAGLSIKEILPYKKRLRALEEEKIFPEIQKGIDAAQDSLILERIHNQSIVRITFIFTILSGGVSFLIIIFLGLYVSRKEKLVDQFREQLISVVSHQLKAPLTIIKGHTELLLESDTSKDDRETIEIIKTTAEDMNVLVLNLLDLSRINQGKFRIEKKSVDIYAIINNIVSSLEPLAHEKNIYIVLKGLKGKFLVQTDELRIRQALQNIIDNGIKYNREGGSLTIELSKEDGLALISIKDEGIGIPKKEAGMIFKRFYRAPNAIQAAHFGTGLGLFVAREIINQSGGEIKFKSIENQGTTFSIRLPIT